MFKPLRIMLAILALVLIVFATPPTTEVVYHGFNMIPSLLMPVLAPIVLAVMLLDALMIRVFLVDKVGEERRNYRLSLYLNLVLVALLILRWYPFFDSL